MCKRRFKLVCTFAHSVFAVRLRKLWIPVSPQIAKRRLISITKKRLYNFEPIKPHFYKVNLIWTWLYQLLSSFTFYSRKDQNESINTHRLNKIVPVTSKRRSNDVVCLLGNNDRSASTWEKGTYHIGDQQRFFLSSFLSSDTVFGQFWPW